ncbi:hypothetical protein PoB_002425200 [Plakobranchus ocellatus]|uniref:Uncharacterized protein n=1 Tax=Plakobranchus ocellatus TaxID=259542 RepID=A0AAV3ZT64_9GAST|nr:hypothetical protein PoB_002425200 [Plakobranchus ocellatus]
MHKAINIKHRIVRRVDIEIAPLATFDTIDLGDEDIELDKKSLSGSDDQQESPSECHRSNCWTPSSHNGNDIGLPFPRDSSPITRTIGGNTSKKSLSQAGREKSQKDTASPPSGASSAIFKAEPAKDSGIGQQGQSPQKSPLSSTPQPRGDAADDDDDDGLRTPVNEASTSSPGVPFNRQSSLGRVSLPVRQPDSDSSSSSSESVNENICSFHASNLSGPHTKRVTSTHAKEQIDVLSEPEEPDSLVPENIDPSQILSPSKRKAYERRIERLKVTTSPIARPRSTTPISVVTLDEYANISSPDASPASPSVLQDKLKITLPVDEFAAKPKTPKHHSGKRRSSEDTIFQFSEENLFSRSKSALLVEDDGQLPLSPRRVLLPPTLSPSSSPRLSRNPLLSKPPGPESITPTLSLSQQKVTAHKFFGETVDETEEENWASFPEPSPTIEAPVSALIPELKQDTTADAPESSRNIYENLSTSVTGQADTGCNTNIAAQVSMQNDLLDNSQIFSIHTPTSHSVDKQTNEDNSKCDVNATSQSNALTQAEIEFYCETDSRATSLEASSQEVICSDLNRQPLLVASETDAVSSVEYVPDDQSGRGASEFVPVQDVCETQFELDDISYDSSDTYRDFQRNFQTDPKEEAKISQSSLVEGKICEGHIHISCPGLHEDFAGESSLHNFDFTANARLVSEDSVEKTISCPSTSTNFDLTEPTASLDAGSQASALHVFDSKLSPNLPLDPSSHTVNSAIISDDLSSSIPLSQPSPTKNTFYSHEHPENSDTHIGPTCTGELSLESSESDFNPDLPQAHWQDSEDRNQTSSASKSDPDNPCTNFGNLLQTGEDLQHTQISFDANASPAVDHQVDPGVSSGIPVKFVDPETALATSSLDTTVDDSSEGENQVNIPAPLM